MAAGQTTSLLYLILVSESFHFARLGAPLLLVHAPSIAPRSGLDPHTDPHPYISLLYGRHKFDIIKQYMLLWVVAMFTYRVVRTFNKHYTLFETDNIWS